jgi:hypothetical protein
MLASSVEHGLRARSCKAVRAIRDLSPSIAPKRIFLAVDVTVNLACSWNTSRSFSGLDEPGTIEWE